MSARDKILHKLTRSDTIRRTYGAVQSVPGLGLAVQKVVHRMIPKGIRIWIRVPQGVGKGLWIYADPRYELGYANGDYEPWIQELLKTELRRGGCYYDVGAHSGFFSLIAARLVGGASGAVVALEPDPRNASLVEMNITRNNLTQISVLRAAVWSSAGEVAFQEDSDLSNRTQGHVSSGGPSISALKVQAVRLDDLVFERGYRAPDLIKMDVEGAEWEALQATRRLLSEAKPKLLCEIHDSSQQEQIRAYLEQFGYAAETWKPVHPHYADYRQLYLWAVPRRQGNQEVSLPGPKPPERRRS